MGCHDFVALDGEVPRMVSLLSSKRKEVYWSEEALDFCCGCDQHVSRDGVVGVCHDGSDAGECLGRGDGVFLGQPSGCYRRGRGDFSCSLAARPAFQGGWCKAQESVVRRFGLVAVIGVISCLLFIPIAAADPYPTGVAAEGSGWVAPTLPGGSVDPYDALVNNNYSSSDMAKILRDRMSGKGIMYRASADLAGGVSDTAVKLETSRLYRILSVGGRVPALKTVVPYVRFAGTAGAVLTAGVVAYELYRTFNDSNGDSQTEKIVILVKRSEWGGESIRIPAVGQEGVDWRASPTEFGWKWVDDLSYTAGSNDPGWVFNVVYDMYAGTTAGGFAWNGEYPATEYSHLPAAGRRWYPIPTWPDYCSQTTSKLTFCLDADAALGLNGGGKPSVAQAQSVAAAVYLTVGEFNDDTFKNVDVTGDSQANATGHINAGDSVKCNRNAAAIDCGLIYVREKTMERMAPYEITDNLPAGIPATVSGSVSISDPVPATVAAAIGAEVPEDDECGRALINHFIDPDNYGYDGCAVGDPGDDGSGATVPAPIPTETGGGGTSTVTVPGVVTVTNPGTQEVFRPFVFPRPSPTETYEEYLERLRDLGWLGEVTLLDDSTSYTGGSDAALAGNGVVTVVGLGSYGSVSSLRASGFASSRYTSPGGDLEWPSNPPVVDSPTVEITIAKKPGDIDSSCNCPAVDFDPLLDAGTGSVFPLGVPSWINTFFDSATASEEPIVWNISRPGGGDDYVIEVPENSYRSYTDPFVKMLVVVGSLWFAFTFLVGWKKGDEGA